MVFSCKVSTGADSLFKESRISEIKSKNTDFKLLQDSTIMIDGVKGIQFTYTTNSEGTDISKGTEIIITKENVRYSIVFISRNIRLYAEYYPEFLKIMNSMEFLEYGIGNCDVARNGKFVYAAFPEKYYLEFNSDKHLEYHKADDRSIYSKIVWVNNCEYNIVFDYTDKPEGWNFKKGDVINVKILSATDKGYKYVWTYKYAKGVNELILVDDTD